MKKTIVISCFLLAAAVVAQAIEYAISYTEFGQECARIESGATAPTNSVTGFDSALTNVPSKYLVIDAGTLREKTTGEKAAYDAAEFTAWEDSKTNSIVATLDGRYLLRLNQVNTALISEGVITNAFTPQNSTPAAVAAAAAPSTNVVTKGRANSLSNILYQVERATLHYIGNPPDGSAIIDNIK